MRPEIGMGRVTCNVKVENAYDNARLRMGEITPDQVRSLEITDALVDTGATSLALPASMIRALGLPGLVAIKRIRNTTGSYEAKLYGPARLWIFDREMSLDVLEVNDDCPVLIGQQPLEYMQLLVDMVNHRIVKSPANNGEWVLEMY